MACMSQTWNQLSKPVCHRPRFKKLGLVVLFFLSTMGLSTQAVANEDATQQMYFPFEPDITTNFIKLDESRHLGFVRVGIEAVVSDSSDLSLVEHHAPLLRDAFIEIFGRTQEGKVRSLTGRQELRQECLEKAQALLERESGRAVIHDLIFTSYLYQ